jgi:hypothetical protein
VTGQSRTHQVAVRCLGAPPVDRVRRASGVSAVEVDGGVLRCRIAGSFQPFLEALRGHEVLTLTSQPEQLPEEER